MSPEEASEQMGEQKLADGVHGWLFDTPNGLYIPIITADRPGSGDVARYLNSLPRERRVVFPSVVSAKLIEMLLRRGFQPDTEYAAEYRGHVDIMVREAKTSETDNQA